MDNQKIKDDMFTEAIDGQCINHKFKEAIFDCETKNGKTTPRWSRKCARCGYKEYSALMDVDYVAVPVVIFSDMSYQLTSIK